MEQINVTDSSRSQYTENKENIVFTPVVSKQRYDIVHQLLTHEKWRDEIISVSEYGCANLNFFPYLKNTDNIQNINFIDIDGFILEERMFYIRPLMYDYLYRRINPLEVKVFEGSISDPDSRILNSDAVIGIEIIEHLFPDTLEAIPYVTFNIIRPKIVIFTTPNADFNIALPKFRKFRHPDHKFEWTREQFESWATNITLRFPQYKVSFFGVGNGPEGTSSLGSCSQLALFVRTDLIDNEYDIVHPACSCKEKLHNLDERDTNLCHDCNPMQPFGICKYLTKSTEFKCSEDGQHFFKLLGSTDYPKKEEVKMTKEELILQSLSHNIYKDYLEYTNEDGVDKIPLHTIEITFEGRRITEYEIRDVLKLHGYEIKDCWVKDYNGKGSSNWAPCVLYRRPETPSSDSESSHDSNKVGSSADSHISDWDGDTTAD